MQSLETKMKQILPQKKNTFPFIPSTGTLREDFRRTFKKLDILALLVATGFRPGTNPIGCSLWRLGRSNSSGETLPPRQCPSVREEDRFPVFLVLSGTCV